MRRGAANLTVLLRSADSQLIGSDRLTVGLPTGNIDHWERSQNGRAFSLLTAADPTTGGHPRDAI